MGNELGNAGNSRTFLGDLSYQVLVGLGSFDIAYS
jgi:hypothetical protein